MNSKIYYPEEDSYLLESLIHAYAKNKSVLDMGSGSGILAQQAIKSNAKSVLASDINPNSIKLLKSKKINCIKSDLFSKIKQKFDLIIFNPPYLPNSKFDNNIDTSGGKNGDEIIIKFLIDSKSHLNKRGIILLLISTYTPRKKIIPLLKILKYRKKTLIKKNLFYEKLEVWEIKHNNQ